MEPDKNAEPLTTAIPETGQGQAAPPSSESVDSFVRLLAQNQRRIFMYVMSLVPNPTDADEVIQETNLILWREFARFRAGTNFAAWACKVAMYQVLAWRKRKKRDRLDFSPEFLETVAEEAIDSMDALEERSAALARCIEKLPSHHREMLRFRYAEGRDIEVVAQQLDRTVDAVYRALSRIRGVLHGCVSRALSQGGAS